MPKTCRTANTGVLLSILTCVSRSPYSEKGEENHTSPATGVYRGNNDSFSCFTNNLLCQQICSGRYKASWSESWRVAFSANIGCGILLYEQPTLRRADALEASSRKLTVNRLNLKF